MLLLTSPRGIATANMNRRPSPLRECIEHINASSASVFLMHGNVYDLVMVQERVYDAVLDVLMSVTKKTFPTALGYNVFDGVKVIRGDEKNILARMGLKTEEVNPNDPNAELVDLLKRAKGAASQSPFPLNPLELFPCLDRLLRTAGQRSLIIIEHLEALIPSGAGYGSRQNERVLAVALCRWGRDREIRETGNIVVLMTRDISRIDDAITDRAYEIPQLRFPKPDEVKRHNFVYSLLRYPKTDTARRYDLTDSLEPDTTFVGAVANAAAGLSLADIKSIIGKEMLAGDDTVIDKIFRRKAQIFRDEYSDTLEIMDTRFGFDAIGGLGKAKNKLQAIAAAIRDAETTLVPQGILFMGPPGTGKTALAESFAKEAGLNFVKPLDIKSMWVGESERRMTRFLNAVKDLAPVAVFIDEFDQNQGQRGGFEGDSGVSRGLFKKMLEVMSDTSLRGKVLWILASNRPDLIDPAMKRPGRCDLRIPFLPPTEEELMLICDAAFKQYPEMRAKVDNWRSYAHYCRGYTGADMIEVVRRAWEICNERGHEVINDDDMRCACLDYVTQIFDKVQIVRMALLALIECSSRYLMPDHWKSQMVSFFEDLTDTVIREDNVAHISSPAQMLKYFENLLR